MAVVLLALIYDFINGFHDTANAVATSISTRALTPAVAVLLAAILNFFGALSGTAVAGTIGQNIITLNIISPLVLIAALTAAICWNLSTWKLGLPSSSSHALIGGLIGGITECYGIHYLNWVGILLIMGGLFLTPIISLLIGNIIMNIMFWILCKSSPIKLNRSLRKMQIISACMASFAHGCNDAQKSMAVITMGLVAASILPYFEVPLWVKFTCALAMGCGTAVGGWRIIKTIGKGIFRLEPVNGLAVDLASSLVIYLSSLYGAPVSTTHVVSSAIMGVGWAKRFKSVKWITAVNILFAWTITMPTTVLLSVIMYNLLKIFI